MSILSWVVLGYSIGWTATVLLSYLLIVSASDYDNYQHAKLADRRALYTRFLAASVLSPLAFLGYAGFLTFSWAWRTLFPAKARLPKAQVVE